MTNAEFWFILGNIWMAAAVGSSDRGVIPGMSVVAIVLFTIGWCS